MKQARCQNCAQEIEGPSFVYNGMDFCGIGCVEHYKMMHQCFTCRAKLEKKAFVDDGEHRYCSIKCYADQMGKPFTPKPAA